MNKWIPYPRFLIRKNIISSILKEEDLNGKKGIEIGFGSGEMLIYFFRRKISISGFDESDLANNLAKERLVQHNCTVELYESFQNIPKNYFDFIFTFEVLEHIKDDSIALDNWLKILRKDGKILLSVPAHQRRFGNIDLSVGHYRRYDKISLINLLTSKGLQVCKFWNYGFPTINILERYSNYLMKRRNQTEFIQKEELSYKSFENRYSFLIKILSNDFVLFPLYILQHLFIKTDLGSGYIILAKKN